jgi:hypothetical protein
MDSKQAQVLPDSGRIEASDLAAALSWSRDTLMNKDNVGDLDDRVASLVRLGTRYAGSPIALRHGRPRVLFVGPGKYVAGVWNTRAKYIFPDLFGPLSASADIYMLTSPVPDFARTGMQTLIDKFGVKVIESRVGNAKAWFQSTLRAVNDIRPDVLTNIFSGLAMMHAIGMTSRLTGVKSILRISGDEIATRLALGMYEHGSEKHVQNQFLEDIGLNLADHIVVMSEEERKRIAKRVLVDRNQITTLVRGVDLARFAPGDAAGGNGAPRKFCYVGRKSLEKGYDLIEQAARIVETEMPDIEFHFAGTFEPGRERNIVYHGFVEAEDLPSFYAASDAFVLCSRNEGLPQALAEAMASAKPCIVSRHLFENLFVDGEDALLVETTPQSVAGAVLRLARDADLGRRLALRSRVMAEASFDRAKQQQLYRQLILG